MLGRGIAPEGGRFKLERNQELHLITTQSPDDEVSQFLETRGSGVFAITFEVDHLDSTKAFLTERLPEEALVVDSMQTELIVRQEFARGVQLEFIQEAESQSTFVSQLMIGKVLDSTATKHAAGTLLRRSGSIRATHAQRQHLDHGVLCLSARSLRPGSEHP